MRQWIWFIHCNRKFSTPQPHLANRPVYVVFDPWTLNDLPRCSSFLSHNTVNWASFSTHIWFGSHVWYSLLILAGAWRYKLDELLFHCINKRSSIGKYSRRLLNMCLYSLSSVNWRRGSLCYYQAERNRFHEQDYETVKDNGGSLRNNTKSMDRIWKYEFPSSAERNNSTKYEDGGPTREQSRVSEGSYERDRHTAPSIKRAQAQTSCLLLLRRLWILLLCTIPAVRRRKVRISES